MNQFNSQEGGKHADWGQYQKLVLSELERLGSDISKIHEKLDSTNECWKEEMTSLKVELAMLRVKAGVWGLIGGAIPVCTYLGFELLKRLRS